MENGELGQLMENNIEQIARMAEPQQPKRWMDPPYGMLRFSIATAVVARSISSKSSRLLKQADARIICYPAETTPRLHQIPQETHFQQTNIPFSGYPHGMFRRPHSSRRRIAFIFRTHQAVCLLGNAASPDRF